MCPITSSSQLPILSPSHASRSYKPPEAWSSSCLVRVYPDLMRTGSQFEKKWHSQFEEWSSEALPRTGFLLFSKLCACFHDICGKLGFKRTREWDMQLREGMISTAWRTAQQSVGHSKACGVQSVGRKWSFVQQCWHNCPWCRI